MAILELINLLVLRLFYQRAVTINKKYLLLFHTLAKVSTFSDISKN